MYLIDNNTYVTNETALWSVVLCVLECRDPRQPISYVSCRGRDSAAVGSRRLPFTEIFPYPPVNCACLTLENVLLLYIIYMYYYTEQFKYFNHDHLFFMLKLCIFQIILIHGNSILCAVLKYMF